jgi:outer membrane protein TolC
MEIPKTMRYLVFVLFLLSHPVFAENKDTHNDSNSIALLLLEQQFIALHQPESLLTAQHYWLDNQQQLANSLLSAQPRALGEIKTDQLGKDTGYQDLIIGVVLPLWWPNERSLAKHAAEELIRWQMTQLAAQRQQLRLTLYRVGEEYVTAQESLHHAQLALEHAQTLLTHVQARHDAGDLSQFDTISAMADWQQRQQDLSMAEQIFEEKSIAFKQLTEQSALPHISQQPVSFSAQFDSQHCASILYKRASSAFILAQLTQAEQASTNKPEITLASEQNRNDRLSETSNRVSVSISVPLNTTAHRQQTSAQLGYELTKAQTELAQTQREVITQWNQYYTRFNQNSRQWQQQQQLNKTLGQQYIMAQSAFRAGELDLRELLRIKSAWLEGQHTAELLKYGQIFSALALKALQEDTGL